MRAYVQHICKIYAIYTYINMKITSITAIVRIPTLPIKCPMKYIYISVFITEYESFIPSIFLNHFGTKEELFFPGVFPNNQT